MINKKNKRGKDVILKEGDIVAAPDLIGILKAKGYTGHRLYLIGNAIVVDKNGKNPMFWGDILEEISRITLADKKQKSLYYLFYLNNDFDGTALDE